MTIARMRVRLTKRTIERADADGYTWDAMVPGLGLRVQRGTRTWVYRYTAGNGRRRQLTLGRWPEVGLEDARELGRRRAAEVGRGRDPLAELRTSSVAELLTAYETRHRTRVKGRAPRDDPDVARRLDVLRDVWGRRAAASITHEDVSALLRRWDHAPYAQNRMRELVRSVWRRGRAWGLVPGDRANPVEGTRANPERPRIVCALTLDEVGALLQAAWKWPNPTIHGVILALVTTGARKNEILRMRWADVDLREGRESVILRDRKGGDDHELPLPLVLADWLRENRNDGEWCFPGKIAGRPLVSIEKPWKWACKAAGLPEGTRIHDVRAAVATVLEASVGLRVAQQVLGHSRLEVTARYVRPGAEARRIGILALEAALGEALRRH